VSLSPGRHCAVVPSEGWPAPIPLDHSHLFGRARLWWAPWARLTNRAMRVSSVIVSSVLRIRDIGNEGGA